MSQSSPTTPTRAAGIAEGPVRNICYEHQFESNDANKFEEHMKSTDHFLVNGSDYCVYCQEPAQYEKLKYKGKGKFQGAVCEECAKENDAKPNAKRIVLEDRNKPHTLSEATKKALSGGAK